MNTLRTASNTEHHSEIEWEDIQGIVRWGYATYKYSAVIRIQFSPKSKKIFRKRWLNSYLPLLGTASKSDSPNLTNDFVLNIAFSSPGLLQFGLDNKDLESFPMEFTEGMDSTRCKHLFGVDKPPTLKWDWGTSDKVPHLIFLAYSKDKNQLRKFVSNLCDTLEDKGFCESKITFLQDREHFGFKDGLSNPIIKGSRARLKPKHIEPGGQVAPGEFLFGYADERGVLPITPYITREKDPKNLLPFTLVDTEEHCIQTVKDFGRNGSFLTIMQLDQDKTCFDEYVSTNIPVTDNSPEYEENMFLAKLMGRWKNGTPVTSSPDKEIKESSKSLIHHNDFGYAATDKLGLSCPVGAHIRRSNPRDTLDESVEKSWKFANRHRILRRGRLYGETSKSPTTETEKDSSLGLMFLALNVSIARQFEHIQQTWINNRRFAGPGETDPIVGSRRQSTNTFTAPNIESNDTSHGLVDFVTQVGGGYFFLPSVSALRVLSHTQSNS